MTEKEKNQIFDDWKTSLNMDWDDLHEYLETIKSYFDFAEFLETKNPSELSLSVVSGCFPAECLQRAFNDGMAHEARGENEFDIENYR